MCCVCHYITAFPFTHIHPIRGQKRVTFAYLVSRVTRKKLSSGASIQLGRLLRIITPPRVFPLLLLRPLCWQKNIKYCLITVSAECIVAELFEIQYTYQEGSTCCTWVLCKNKARAVRERCKECMRGLSVEKSINWFISFPSYKWCNK